MVQVFIYLSSCQALQVALRSAGLPAAARPSYQLQPQRLRGIQEVQTAPFTSYMPTNMAESVQPAAQQAPKAALAPEIEPAPPLPAPVPLTAAQAVSKTAITPSLAPAAAPASSETPAEAMNGQGVAVIGPLPLELHEVSSVLPPPTYRQSMSWPAVAGVCTIVYVIGAGCA